MIGFFTLFNIRENAQTNLRRLGKQFMATEWVDGPEYEAFKAEYMAVADAGVKARRDMAAFLRSEKP